MGTFDTKMVEKAQQVISCCTCLRLSSVANGAAPAAAVEGDNPVASHSKCRNLVIPDAAAASSSVQEYHWHPAPAGVPVEDPSSGKLRVRLVNKYFRRDWSLSGQCGH